MIHYRCTSCGNSIKSTDVVYRCPSCSSLKNNRSFQKGNLLIELDIPFFKSRLSKKLEDHNYNRSTLYPINPLDLYPIPVGSTAVDCHQSFPAGNTPLGIPTILKESYGLDNLWFKLEGANPSGSLKDRASLLVAAQARQLGQKTIVLASTGNAGSAMSCAGAALGLEVILLVPASAPREKLTQSLFYGATVIPIEGTYDEAFELSLEYSQNYGGLNRNTAYNPMTIEGKKSAAIEIFNQMGGSVPDILYIPTGDGVIYTGLCKGFEDLHKLGLIQSLPVCIAVQAEGSNALSQSFTSSSQIVLESSNTLADSISVCSPACGEPALQYLEKTKGWCVEVSDDDILDAQCELAEKAGIFVEPSSASVWAAIKKEKLTGTITGKEHIAGLLTGIGFKDMSVISSRVSIPKAVDTNLSSVVEAIERVKSNSQY